jgi:hypothetical protein
MAEEPRAEVLRALTRPARLEGDRADALLDASPAERALAARVLLAEAAEVLADAGVLRPQQTVLDLTLRQASSLAAALGRLGRWWPQPAYERHRLGDILKLIPSAEAAAVVDLLTWGGWLTPTADPDQHEGPG